MVDLPLTKISETATTITLGWTPITCLGYVLYADGVRKSNSWDPSKSSWKTNKAKEIKVVAVQTIAEGVYPPVVPPPNLKFAQPGQLLSVINGASPGDTVVAVGGTHPKLTLTKSFPITGPRVTVGCDSSSLVQGVNVAGQKGYRFAPVGDPYSFHSKIPVELVDYNITPFYASGDCDVIVGGLLEGGYDGVKVYGSQSAFMGVIVLDGVTAEGNGGDCCHVNGAKSFIARNYVGRNPADAGAEHHDGLQIERAQFAHIGPNVDITWPVTPRRDEPNNGMLLQGELSNGPGILELEIDGVTIHQWWGGRGFQLTSAKKATVRNLSVVDCGNGKPYPGPGSPPITLGGVQGAGMVYDLYGVSQSQVYMNNSYATVNFHP